MSRIERETFNAMLNRVISGETLEGKERAEYNRLAELWEDTNRRPDWFPPVPT